MGWFLPVKHMFVFRYKMMTFSQETISLMYFPLWLANALAKSSSNTPSSVKHYLGQNSSPLPCFHIGPVNVFILIQSHKQQTARNCNLSLTGLRTLTGNFLIHIFWQSVKAEEMIIN